jgi:ABC-2 type transport system permease protein
MSNTRRLVFALARSEALRLWREPRLRWIAALAPLLLLTIFTSTINSAGRLAHERTSFSAAERTRWLDQGFKDPHSAAHFGVWAVKPASPLSALMPGIEPFVGLAVWLEAHKRNEMIFRPRQEADPVMRSATSVAHLLALLGPLFAILLGFAGFARERERGTLRMALGNGASATRLLLLRFCILAAVLACMLVVPAAALGGYALWTLPAAGWEGGYRLALWCLLHLLYLLMFLLVSMSVSLRAGSARAALAALLTLWLVFCVVLPRAASEAAGYLSPTPSYHAVRTAAEQEAPAYENAQKWEARAQALGKANGAAVLNGRAARLDQSERDSHTVFDRLLGRFYSAVEQQDRSFGRLGAFTPAVALDAAGASVAGTDFHHHRHFIDAAETYRRTMVNRLNGELMEHAEHVDAGAATGRAFWESVPVFAYQPPSLRTALANVAVPLLLLLAWCGAAGALAWRSARGVTP